MIAGTNAEEVIPCADSTGPDPPHPALYNQDVLALLFDVFNPFNRTDRATCARSARVCRAWAEPASSVVWSKGVDLTILFRILHRPSSLDTMARKISSSDPGMTQEKLQVIRHEAWQSFLRCGARIRELSEGTFGLIPAYVELTHFLIRKNGTQTFLPHLKTLHWRQRADSSGILVRLVPPSLESLVLHVDELTAGCPLGTLGLQLSSAAPFLRRLEITCQTGLPISFLIPLKSIRELTLHNVLTAFKPEDVRRLLKAPNLEALHLSIKNFAKCQRVMDSGPNLRSIYCIGMCEDLASFISLLDAPNLYDLGMYLLRPGDVDALRSLIGELKSAPCTRSVRSLKLIYGNSALRCDPTPLRYAVVAPQLAVGKIILQPLFGHFNQLDTLIVGSCHCPSVLTDDDVLMLAKAWPGLKKLSLPSHATSPYCSRVASFPSVASLYHLSYHCPELIHLEIELGDITLPPKFLQYPIPRIAHRLRTLKLSSLRWIEPDALALVLAEVVDGLFPTLDVDVCIRDKRPHLQWHGWPLMWAKVRELQAGRERRSIKNWQG
ncbi:hypothetical protein BD310DRAFT_831934 [Dichomitus squalens]|uniref:F-box domain-containing protein n=1 Tax=Dichomitus squalens TaxID=114155 RepID=A0A4Q9PGU3_9APHY|nr:hypothetical protein BD310DRAFT_831934 [Dichomitus squalens]